MTLVTQRAHCWMLISINYQSMLALNTDRGQVNREITESTVTLY